MNSALKLCCVLLAVYGLVSLLLSFVIVVAWRAGVDRALATSNDLLAARLVPAGGAALAVLAVALPAFLIYEPGTELEAVGPLPVALALFALLMLADGVRRGWRAAAAARALLRSAGRVEHDSAEDGRTIEIVDFPLPLVAVVGGWRPRIVAARQVVDACAPEEFRQVIAHEAAHVSSLDNLKLLLLAISPDPLAWLATGATLAARWRLAAEFEADERAAGADRRKRVALAAALLKVARLAAATHRPLPVLTLPVALDDVEGRVRRLLAGSRHAPRPMIFEWLAASALLVPLAAAPFYPLVQRLIEAVVAFGR